MFIKTGFLVFAFLVPALSWAGDPVLFNPSPFRPVFNLEGPRGTISRDLGTGTALDIDPGTRFSGVGLKKATLEGLCYFAEWKGHRGIFQLVSTQILIYNANTGVVQVQVESQKELPGHGWLARGNFALVDGEKSVRITTASGESRVFPVEGGKAYLILKDGGLPTLVAVN